ncbi:hypothetical protein [Polaromonas sp. UC242_47]|uniref:hypothetical protein n=1 Tax=Polaromonas sp. UC242_47 TaxID=3374626 RepID=UPI0037BA787C
MLNALLGQTAEAHRHAYNAAFEELGLTWYWDAATYARLQAHGRNAVRVYLETEQAHLLRAYEADFLIDAIEAAQLRCHTSTVANRPRPASHSWISNSYGCAPDGPRQHASSSTPTHRPASTALT